MSNKDAIKAYKPWYEYLKANHEFLVDIDLVTVAALCGCEKEEVRAELEALDTPKESPKEEEKKLKAVTYEEAINRMRPAFVLCHMLDDRESVSSIAATISVVFDFGYSDEDVKKVYHDLRGW